MNTAFLANSLMSKLPLPPSLASLPPPPQLPPPLQLATPTSQVATPTSQVATPTSQVATPTITMQDHNRDLNSSLSGSEAHLSSPLRGPQMGENGGMRINYEGRVSLLAHTPIYGSGNGTNHVTTTLDDSREERGSWTDDQMSPGKEQSSSPDALLPKSDDHQMNRSDDDTEMRAPGDSLERLREICNKSLPQHGNTMIDTASNETLQADGSTLFHCHLCTFTSVDRDEYNEHTNDHYEFRCPKCDFDTKSEQDYKNHLKEEHNLTPEDLDDDQGIRVPKVNSQGKVKVFKCKQCEFVAVTKEDFWRHSKMHIKPEKMLNCPKCPFVTEYKHHLEYHLRNHFGSKPFKCPSCSYTCVNKSMLNSHMKSHTNIYQYRCDDCTYATKHLHSLKLHLRKNSHKPAMTLNNDGCPFPYRCADCNYATKYCHSLKLHLRKYAHKPAMVLNNDGTPNPLPIIDVYGTRRGPKKKTDADGNPINMPIPAGSLSPEAPTMVGGLGPLRLPGSSISPTSPGSIGGPGGLIAPGATRFPLLPPFVMQQMQMQMQQSLNQSGSPIRLGQMPQDMFPGMLSPVRRLNERGDSSEMEEDDRRSPLNVGENNGSPNNGARPKNNQNKSEKLKCAICDFETVSHDIYRNHLMLHATKDQDSPPPTGFTSHHVDPSNLPNLPQYPLQIRSPLAINAEAKAAAAASALLRRARPLSSNESENEAPSSSIKQEQEKLNLPPLMPTSNASMDYLEYLKKMAPLWKQSMTPSPNPMVSSTQAAAPSPPVMPPAGPGSATSELISRLYFGNMVKNLKTPSNPSPNTYDSQPQKPSSSHLSSVPIADSSSGALDLSRLQQHRHKSDYKTDSSTDLPQSRPASGSQTSTVGSSGKSRRKGKAYKIERKLLDDRDSLNSVESYEHDERDEVKSDGSTASGSGKEPGTTTLGSNGDRHHIGIDEEATGMETPTNKSLAGSHVCKFCEIAFMDSIMYTIHMGYHGYQNPFKCNLCGEETTDKVGFFLHIARKAHQ